MTDRELLKMCRDRGGHVGLSMAELMAQAIVQDAVSPVAHVKSQPRHIQGRLNKTEAKHARYLEGRKQAGEIADFWFEAVKLRLADKTWYTPDFFVKMTDGTFECHEVKGFMRDDAAVKLKVAARLFPCFTFRLFHKGKEQVVPHE